VFKDRRKDGERRGDEDRRVEDAQAGAERREGVERRSASDRRRRTLLSAKIIYNDRKSIMSCTVRNLSQNGARLIFGVTPICPSFFTLDLGDGQIHRCEVAYRVGPIIGVHFLDTPRGEKT